MYRLAATLMVLVASARADAASLTLAFDKSVYTLGETISLVVTGDSEGGVDALIGGRLLHDEGLVSGQGTPVQSQLTSYGLPWELLTLGAEPGARDLFKQLCCLSVPSPIDEPLVSTAEYLAVAPGVATFTWEESGTFALDFFGLTSAPGASITIVPEPATAVLLALGLAGLAWHRPRPRASRIRTR